MSPCQAGGLCGLCSDRQRVHLSASMNNTEKEREKEHGGWLSTSSVERVQMCSYHKSTPMMHFLGQSVGSQCSCVPERAKQLWEEGHTTHSEPIRKDTHSETVRYNKVRYNRTSQSVYNNMNITHTHISCAMHVITIQWIRKTTFNCQQTSLRR